MQFHFRLDVPTASQQQSFSFFCFPDTWIVDPHAMLGGCEPHESTPYSPYSTVQSAVQSVNSSGCGLI